MELEKQIKTILKNILDEDRLKIYIGNKMISDYNYYYVNYGGKYSYNIYVNKNKYIGVYWLYDGNEIVYIGYSKNLINRMTAHVSQSSDKVWDKVKIILFDNIKIARSVERTLLLNIQTKYNSPKFNKGYTAESRYKAFKDEIKSAIKYYNIYSTLYWLEVAPGCVEYINNIDWYRRYADMSFEEYEENFNLKLKGLKHDLLIT
jgi:predicted GIY-YIG superfamily endonuclease